MKKFKLLTIAVLAAIAVCSAFAFAACGSEIKVHEHVFEEIAEAQYLKKAATCTEQAEYYKSCECGEKSTETFKYAGSKLAHKSEWYPVIDDVEVCTGHKYVKLCSVCKQQPEDERDVYRVEPAHSDSWTVVSGKEPTEESTGLLKGICKECERAAEYTLPKLNKTDYNYSIIEHTADTVETHVYSISVDGQDFEFKIEFPDRHIFKGKTVDNDGKIKSYNDYPDVNVKGRGDITCDEKGTACVYECDACHGFYDIIVRKDHVKPTDESKITIKYDSCEDVRLVYYDCPNCNDDVTAVKETLPALGHKFDYTLEIDDAEAKTWKITGVCTNEINGVVCGEHDDVSGIADSAVVIKEEATCTKGAVRSYLYKDVECTFTEAETRDHRYVDSVAGIDKLVKLSESGTVYKKSEFPNLSLMGDRKNALCSELGNPAVFECADCGSYFMISLKYEHAKGADVTHLDPTCTTPETTDYECATCHEHVHEEGAAALGHKCTVTVENEPTLETAGKAVVTCARCDLSITIELPALNSEDYVVTTVEKQTCVKYGVTKYTYKYGEELKDQKGLPELVYTVTTETLSDHVNPDSPETVIVVIDGKRCRGYICANCHKFVIVETLG